MKIISNQQKPLILLVTKIITLNMTVSEIKTKIYQGIPKEYLNIIRPYLSNIINDHKTHGKLKFHSGNKIISYKTPGEWKIQLSMTVNFVSSEDSSKIRTMLTKSDNIDILLGSEMDDIIKELFKSLLQRFQEGLEESMRGSEFIIDSVNLSEYKLNQINIGNFESYINSPKWLKNKKATLNSKNNDEDCFQYGIIAALNHKQSKVIQREYLTLSLLLICIIGKRQTFHCTQQKTGKSLNQIINQLLLRSYLCHTILKE